MAAGKKVVLVACGTGIATSTVVNKAVEKIAKENIDGQLSFFEEVTT